MIQLKKVTLYMLFVAFFSAPAHSQEADRPEENSQYLSISVENDNFGGGTDRFYTSGVRASWFDSDINVPPVIDKLADEIPTFDLNETTSTVYTLGHNIYTPEDIKIAGQPQDDRPWAAFLYGSVGLATITYNEQSYPSHVDELEFTLGVVGPEALGEQTQKFVHKHLIESPIPQGWDNQLDFEPGIIISWQRRVPYAWEKQIGPVHTRIEPNFSVSLGNIRTNVGAGATLVTGSDKRLDTPTRVRPAVPGTGVFLTDDDKFNWQLFAGVDGRAVARDIFLDGNSFSNSHSADKRYFVGDLSAGASLFYGDYRVSYTINARSKEFKDQNEESVFGSVTLTKRF